MDRQSHAIFVSLLECPPPPTPAATNFLKLSYICQFGTPQVNNFELPAMEAVEKLNFVNSQEPQPTKLETNMNSALAMASSYPSLALALSPHPTP